ncbi:MAG: hypothetical protein HOE30_24600 [Deltaproteobacteria bacterium]|jgi:lysophospholipase L1-like esterase|nr:hypothetical protein [Deltaproteobacteria bacterium]MBT4269553.1 hypothetical protein [Deltaproteobacteria bacterium]MBT4642118.1 hypothetical protein [Deltaproteobacteria bacterium]MBT6767344.1 hypothetical protein [Prolixibacteraceae bacterium]MBT7711933.1 hypothetical protein [Deltaproteobacteria bacterium]
MIKTYTVLIRMFISITFFGTFSGCYLSTSSPQPDPQDFLQSGLQFEEKVVVVCIGDSLTMGNVSYNYVNELAQRFSQDDYGFVNAGFNSELTHNTLQRLDDIIRINPQFVTILIGTNDVLATLCEKCSEKYMKNMKLP